jgi:hypothetical protein
LILVVLGTTGPIVAGDDLYAVHEGPELYELDPKPETQREFTSGEYQSLRATATFLETYDENATSMFLTRWGIEHFGSPMPELAGVDEAGITTEEDLFIYRTRWPDHTVIRTTAVDQSQSSIIMSEQWLEGTVGRNKKVYDTGSVGLVYTNESSVLNPRVDR